MSERARVEALVRNCYTRRSAGEVDAIMECFGPDATFRLAGDEVLGELTTEVKGQTALRPLMEQLVKAWDWSQFKADSILIDGNRAVVHGTGTMRFLPKGQDFATETLDLITVVDDKIIEFVEFCDTHMVAKTMGMPK